MPEPEQVVEETTEAPVEEPKEEVKDEIVEEKDWRQTFVENRKIENPDKVLKQLERYASQEAMTEAHLALVDRMRSGEFMPKFPKGGNEEEIAKWREDAGIPAKADGYNLQLKDGIVPGEEDQDIINSFKEIAHASNMTPAQLNSAVSWYYDTMEQETQARHEEDMRIKEEIEDKLRLEWGSDFRKNKAIIEAYLDTGPQDMKDKILGARLGDGTPLASDMDILRFLVEKAREFNPAMTVVPGEGAGQEQAITDELQELRNASAAPKGSHEWRKYWQQGGDKRYRELLEITEKMAQRK